MTVTPASGLPDPSRTTPETAIVDAEEGGGYGRLGDAHQPPVELEGDLLPGENPVEHRTERFVDHVNRNAGVGIDVGRAGDEGVLVTFGDVFEDVRNRGVAHRQRDALFGALLLGRRSPDSAA